VACLFSAVFTPFQMSNVGGMDHGDNDDSGGLLDDTVFIQGLPETVTEELLAKHFATAGTIKVLRGYLQYVNKTLISRTIGPRLQNLIPRPVTAEFETANWRPKPRLTIHTLMRKCSECKPPQVTIITIYSLNWVCRNYRRI